MSDAAAPETPEVAIRPARLKDAEAISALVFGVFEAFVAPDYGPKGHATFRDFSSPTAIALRLSAGNAGFVALEPDDPNGGARIVGYIETSGDHITELFVAADRQRRGIARRLFDRAFAEREYAEVTVNASPYAEPIYARLGFQPAGDWTEKHGLRYRPMVRRG